MDYVKNPVFVDQNYCPRGQCDDEFPSRVKISHVLFKNIIGTSASQDAINLACSESVPCEDVELNHIDLVYLKKGKARMASSSCSNVNGGRSPTPLYMTTKFQYVSMACSDIRDSRYFHDLTRYDHIRLYTYQMFDGSTIACNRCFCTGKMRCVYLVNTIFFNVCHP
ncbi:hypothetical protein Taro_054412 [Colocasia esculenta]|uniref:Uncharacterized protein n=1 Tax=Colocasia esculenta TaxID=4460 RepID=A0A843XQD0_COLES|nr:hypothetical protein [Colocasia esculenta]